MIEAAERATKAAADARRGEERARNAIPADDEMLGTASPDALRAAGDEQQARLGRLDALREVARQAAAEEKAAAAARRRAVQLATALDKGQGVIAERRQGRGAAVATRDAARAAAGALPSARASADSAKRMAADAAALVKDEETLDEGMNVLDGLREGGRIVGIVSHVSELRQRIPTQAHVSKGRHGSRVMIKAG